MNRRLGRSLPLSPGSLETFIDAMHLMIDCYRNEDLAGMYTLFDACYIARAFGERKEARRMVKQMVKQELDLVAEVADIFMKTGDEELATRIVKEHGDLPIGCVREFYRMAVVYP